MHMNIWMQCFFVFWCEICFKLILQIDLIVQLNSSMHALLSVCFPYNECYVSARLSCLFLLSFSSFRTYLLFVSVFPLPLCHVSLSLYVNPQLLSINMECLFIMWLPGLTSVYKHLSCSSTKIWCTALRRGTCLFTSKLKRDKRTTDCV